MTISFYKGFTKSERNPEIGTRSEFCPISGDWGKLRIPNLARMSIIKCYCMLLNAEVTAFTIFELLRENRKPTRDGKGRRRGGVMSDVFKGYRKRPAVVNGLGLVDKHSLTEATLSRMFVKIGALKNFAVFNEKHLCWNTFLIKL